MQKGAIVTLLDDNFETEVFQSKMPFLVKIGAIWSGSCHIMAPILRNLALEYHKQIKIGSFDIKTDEITAREYGITELPILLIFKGGELFSHLIGMVPKTVIQTRIDNVLGEN